MKKMRKIDKELFGNVRSSSCDGNIVKQLISAGANPDIRDESGKNPLYYVRDTDVARFLIKSGANLQNRDEYERTPLFSVAVPEVAELFLLAGANVNAADRNGETPLFTVKDAKIAEILLRHGADPNVQNLYGKTPLHSGNKNVTGALLRYGGNPNATDINGDTPLHEPQDPDSIRLLLEYGADIHAKNSRQETPFGAMFITSDETYQVFLEAGADPNAQNDAGFGPLFAANTRRQVELLVKHGVNINLRHPDGSTALFHVHSAYMGQVLLAFGADACIRDSFGRSCLLMERCCFTEKIILAPFLIDAGADPRSLSESLRQEPEIAEFIAIRFCDLLRHGCFSEIKPSKLHTLTTDQMIEMISQVPEEKRKSYFGEALLQMGISKPLSGVV